MTEPTAGLPKIVRTYIQGVSRKGTLEGSIFINTPTRGPYIGLPGGGVEKRESAENKEEDILEAAIREDLEETGIPIEPADIWLAHSWMSTLSYATGQVGIKYILFAIVPTSHILKWRYNPTHNPSRPQPKGNEGEVALFVRKKDLLNIFHGGLFIQRHFDYLIRPERNYLEDIKQGRLITRRTLA